MARTEKLTDVELVAQFVRDRSQTVFEELYDRHSQYLFRVALRMLNRNVTAAEEVMQETWIRAVAALHKFRGDSALRTWLCGITINCCRESWRRKEFVALDEAPALGEAVPHQATEHAAARVEDAIRALDPQAREIIELHCIMGHTHEEVAEILGVAPGTSKSRLFRARETLRALLGTDQEMKKRSFR